MKLFWHFTLEAIFIHIDYSRTPNVDVPYGTVAPAIGNLINVDSSFSTTEYMTFDNFGRLTRSKQTTDGVEYGDDAHPMTYTYNLSGALIEEHYPSGRVVDNEFESDGDISRIYGKANSTATERTYASSFSYTPDGKIAKLRLGNGLWEAARFNTRLQKSGVIYEATL